MASPDVPSAGPGPAAPIAPLSFAIRATSKSSRHFPCLKVSPGWLPGCLPWRRPARMRVERGASIRGSLQDACRGFHHRNCLQSDAWPDRPVIAGGGASGGGTTLGDRPGPRARPTALLRRSLSAQLAAWVLELGPGAWLSVVTMSVLPLPLSLFLTYSKRCHLGEDGKGCFGGIHTSRLYDLALKSLIL